MAGAGQDEPDCQLPGIEQLWLTGGESSDDGTSMPLARLAAFRLCFRQKLTHLGVAHEKQTAVQFGPTEPV